MQTNNNSATIDPTAKPKKGGKIDKAAISAVAAGKDAPKPATKAKKGTPPAPAAPAPAPKADTKPNTPAAPAPAPTIENQTPPTESPAIADAKAKYQLSDAMTAMPAEDRKAAALASVQAYLLHGVLSANDVIGQARDTAKLLKQKVRTGTSREVAINWEDKHLGFTGKYAAVIPHLLAGKSCSQAAKDNGHGESVNVVRGYLNAILTAKGVAYDSTARLTLNPEGKGPDRVTISYAPKPEPGSRKSNSAKDERPAVGKTYPVRFKVVAADPKNESKGYGLLDTATGKKVNHGWNTRTEATGEEFAKLFDKLVTFPEASLKTLAATKAQATGDQMLTAKAAESLIDLLYGEAAK